MSESTPSNGPADAIGEGARARSQRRPKDSCPYAAGSPEREAWLEGYDGLPADRSPDQPLDGS